MHLPKIKLFRVPVLALTSLSLVASPTSAQAAQNKATASSVIGAAKAAIAKQTSVRVVVSSTSGHVKSTLVVDIGTKSGVESITTGTESVHIMVNSKYAYLSGNVGGLTKIMGLTAVQQKRVGSKSISMVAGSTPYNNFKSHLTYRILSAVLPSLAGTALSSGTGSHAKDYQLNWSSGATGTTPATRSQLVISSGSKHLPVIEYIRSSTGSGTTTFSKWGERIRVNVPTSSITYAKALAK